MGTHILFSKSSSEELTDKHTGTRSQAREQETPLRSGVYITSHCRGPRESSEMLGVGLGRAEMSGKCPRCMSCIGK